MELRTAIDGRGPPKSGALRSVLSPGAQKQGTGPPSSWLGIVIGIEATRRT